MEDLTSVYVILLSLSIVLLFPLLYTVLLDGVKTTLQKVFISMLSVTILWILFQLFHILFSNVFLMTVFDYASVVFALASVITFTIFIGLYTEHTWVVNKKVLIAYNIPIVAALVYTGFRYITEPVIVRQLGGNGFTYVFTPTTLVDTISILYVCSTFVILLGFLVKSFIMDPPKRREIPLLFVGALVPGALGILSFTKLVPAPFFSHASLGFSVFAVCGALAVFKFKVLDVKPIAIDEFVTQLPDPLLICDMDNNIVDWNPAAETVFSQLNQNSNKRPLSELPISEDKMRAILEKKGDINLLQFSQNGEQKYYSAVLTVATFQGKDIGKVLYFKDVTSLEERRKELHRQNEQLEKFASGITHELRNPLFVAQQYAEMYFKNQIEGYPEQPDVQPEEAYDKIKNSQDRLEEIIEDVEWLSKYGQTIEETQEIELKPLINAVWDTIKTENCSLTVIGNKTITANESRLKSVFDNLIKNSVRYASDGAEITIEVTDTQIIYTDEGPGIPEEEADNIFDYGYTTSDEGTGFGMSMIKTVVDAHNWEIEIDTDYEDGAKFVITYR